MQTVIETPFFLADAKATNRGYHGARRDPRSGRRSQVRIGGKGKGKSSGYRVITFCAAEDMPVFLLRLVSKGQHTDISQAERNDVRAALATLAEDYRESTLRKVQALAKQ